MQGKKDSIKFSFQNNMDELSLSILNAIHDGVLVADKDEIIQFTNPEYCRIVDVPPEELLHRNISVVRPGAMLPSVIRTGKPLSGVYREVGEARYVVDMAPIIIDNEIVGGISIVKNITEIKRLSEALKEAETSLKRLQGTVANFFRAKFQLNQLKGKSAKFNQTISLAERAALGEANILILGESGTGKELLAQGIHAASLRKHGPFVPVNCAAIPHVLLESELFGYAEGAFTGAKRGGKLGLFQMADKGTLFLDEIGDLHFDVQAKILRILQEQKVRRVGELEEREYDVRIIAATNQDLEQMVKKGRFREDLFYRLNVFQLNVPPLRERKEDIVELGLSLMHDYSENNQYVFSDEVKQMFLAYDWPGNIRELKNIIEYICNVVNRETIITPEHLPERLKTFPYLQAVRTVSMQPLAEQVRAFEQQILQNLLTSEGHSLESKKRICNSLGISLATFYRKLEG